MTSGNRGYPAADDAAAEPSTNGFYVGDDYLDSLAIPGITEEEADRFLNALRGES